MNFLENSFLLKEKIKTREPFAAGKIGINELKILHNYFNNEDSEIVNGQELNAFSIKGKPDIFDKKILNLGSNDPDILWNDVVIERAYLNNGLFPKNHDTILYFVKEILDSIKNLDICANWTIPRLKYFEKILILKMSNSCELIDARSIEPYYSGIPWTEELRDKKVLIISPFTKSIEMQYQKRNLIWQDPRILPDFELITLHHQLNPNLGVESKYASWAEMLEDIKKQISNINFDIALIGTGASSLPIAAHCKRLGKQGIHLGGSLQILFGINGKRWEEKPIIKSFQNRHWTKVLPEETPPKFKENESGCYW